MYGTRHTSPLAHLRRGVLAALAGLALTANAQVNSPGMIVNDTVVFTPGMQRIEIGGQGRPIVTQGQPNLTTNNGPLTLNRSLVLRNPSNVPIDVVARTPIPPATVGRLLRRGLQILPVIAAGQAIYDTAVELGFVPSKDAQGVLTVQRNDPTICTVAPCYAYTAGSTGGAPAASGQYNTETQACQASVDNYNALGGTFRASVQSAVFPTCVVAYTNRASGASGGTANTQLGRVTVAPRPAVLQPSSLADLEAAAVARSSWPSGSRLPQAIADVTAREPERVTSGTNTVSGPAQSQGSTSVTNNPDGTRTTTTTVHNHTYAGNTVNTTTVTTVSVFNPVNNTTVNTTTTTTPTPPQEQQTQCELYPNSLGCKELDQAPAEQVPRETRNVTYAPESVNWGASASCPAPISIGTFAGGARQLDFAPFCDVAERARPFVLAGAAMLAMMILVAGIRV